MCVSCVCVWRLCFACVWPPQVHYKRPGDLTPLGQALQRARAPDVTDDPHGLGYAGGGGVMGMGGPMSFDDLETLMSSGSSSSGRRVELPRSPPRPRPDPEICMMLESMGFGAHAAQRAALGAKNRGVAEAQVRPSGNNAPATKAFILRAALERERERACR